MEINHIVKIKIMSFIYISIIYAFIIATVTDKNDWIFTHKIHKMDIYNALYISFMPTSTFRNGNIISKSMNSKILIYIKIMLLLFVIFS